ncbi:MAG: FAD-dependent oxidoreductase [Cyanobacteria bacterium P01_C01_bin.121]
MSHTVVIGADPAGLTASYELAKHHCDVTVLEASNTVGGLFRTESFQGYSIDLGTGGFSTQDEAVARLWDDLVGEDAVAVEVRSLVHFHHRLFNYPLSVTNALKHLGPIDVTLSGLSYLAAQQTSLAEERTAEDWINRRFGKYLGRTFFDPYLQKVWGVPGDHLASEMVSRSLTRPSGKDNTLVRAAIGAVADIPPKTVAYPSQGMGQVWETCKSQLEQAGAAIAIGTQLIRLEHSNHRVTQAIATTGKNIQTIPVEHLVSSVPLCELVTKLNAPANVQNAAECLKHRNIIQVALVLDVAELFGEQWLYVHRPDVLVSRVQNYKNWSLAMVPKADTTCLGLTYFCEDADVLWHASAEELVQMASRELVALGIIECSSLVHDGVALRQQHAYPIHTVNTHKHLAIVQNYLEGFDNLQVVGRQGLHSCAPLESCIWSGQQAAENILGQQITDRRYARPNLWNDRLPAVQVPKQVVF